MEGRPDRQYGTRLKRLRVLEKVNDDRQGHQKQVVTEQSSSSKEGGGLVPILTF